MRPLLVAAVCSSILGMPAASSEPDLTPLPAAGWDWRQSVRAFAEEHFRHPAWGYSHSSRDYALAKELAAEDDAALDDDILFAASYLHDIAAFAPWAEDGRDHSDVGADLLATILKDTGFPMHKIEGVQAATRTHMYYRDPASPEAIYLHDADALDWLGAIGVARIVALVDSEGGKPDGPAAVKMLEDNLAKVPGRLFSPAGKAREPARKAELEQFLRSLRGQSQDLRDL